MTISLCFYADSMSPQTMPGAGVQTTQSIVWARTKKPLELDGGSLSALNATKVALTAAWYAHMPP